MTMQLIFSYETGDAGKDCPYYQNFVIAESETGINADEIEDSISSYMESTAFDGKSYEEMTADVMNASGYKWNFLDSKPVSIGQTRTFWI